MSIEETIAWLETSVQNAQRMFDERSLLSDKAF